MNVQDILEGTYKYFKSYIGKWYKLHDKEFLLVKLLSYGSEGIIFEIEENSKRIALKISINFKNNHSNEIVYL